MIVCLKHSIINSCICIQYNFWILLNIGRDCFSVDFNVQNISIFRILRQPWVDSLCMLNLIHWSACLLLVNILRLISGVLVYHIILINILPFHLVKLQKFSSLHIDYSIQLRCIHTPLYPSHFEFEYFKQKWKMHMFWK